MGREGKLKLKRLEDAQIRKDTYSKRKNGIVKKAKELSTLCDVDLAVLTFSPCRRGKPTLCVGDGDGSDDFSLVVEKLARLSVQERTNRQNESLKLLRRILKRDDRDIDLQDFSVDDGTPRVEEMQNQLNQLRLEIIHKNQRLSTFLNPEEVDDTNVLRTTEESLVESLRQLKIKKASLTPSSSAAPQASPSHIAPLGNPNSGLANGDGDCAASTSGEKEYVMTELTLGLPNANQ